VLWLVATDDATDLLHHHVYHIAILHVQVLGGLSRSDAFAIEEEAHRVLGHALTLAEGRHELLERRCHLALEVCAHSIVMWDTSA